MKGLGKKIMCGILLGATLATGLPALSVHAADAEPRVIAYADAVKMSVTKLSDLLSLDGSIKELKDQKEFVSPDDAKTLDKQIDNLKLNQQIIKGSTEMSLMNTLVNIDNNEMDIRLMKETITLNEENLRRVTLKHQYGMASDNDLRVAEQTLSQNQANLETLYMSMDNERQSLNKILQLALTQEVVVEYERTISDLPENLDTYIADMIKADPVVKQKQITVDLKKKEKDNNYDTSQDTPLKNEYNKAVRERDDAKKSLEAAIRANYNKLEQLTKQGAALQVDLEKANDTYRTAQANLKAGLVTQYEVDNAALSILNNEIAIEKNLNSYWTLYFAFAHPYLLSN